MSIVVCNYKYEDIKEHIRREEQIIVVKKFEDDNICHKARESAHLFTKEHTPATEEIKSKTFWRMDVLPSNTQTDRIFRTIMQIYENENNLDLIKGLFRKMIDLQIVCLGGAYSDSKDSSVKPQIIHYPTGGGFFDWHTHPRFPTNYGIILNLSQKDDQFYTGSTEFKIDNGQIVNVEEYVDIGDLILFRYDLPHRVTPCDPEKNLEFSSQGRWTAIVPIY